MGRPDTYLSQYNYDPGVTGTFALPRSVIINDVTLREGEEGAEVAFSAEDKFQFALLLDAARVPQIEIGYAGKSVVDRQVITRLKGAGLRAQLQTLVQAYLDDWQEQCDHALGCGADVVGLLLPAATMRIERVHNLTKQQILEMTSRTVHYVAGRGGTASLIPFDATRAEIGFLRAMARAAADAGAKRLVLADTVGGAMPAAIRYLVSEMIHAAPIAVGIHCHNDFGLGLANTLAALEAGASVLDASANGLGERCGNTSLDELAVAIQLMYGLPTGIDLSQLLGISRQAETLAGVALPPGKPLVGENAFALRLDSRIRALQSYPGLVEIIPPESIGNHRTISLGANTGPLGIRCKLDQLGLAASEAQAEQLASAVRIEAARVRAGLDDTRFLSIYQAMVSQPNSANVLH